MSMKKRLCAAVLMLAVAALPLSAGAAGLRQRPADMGMGTVSVAITAGAYKLVLMIGPMQQMYTRDQYAKKHPKHGEVMLRGTMVMGGMGGMGMQMPNRHLELHVMDRQTMHVVSNALVKISYQAGVGMGQMAMKPTKLPIAVMMGIGMGTSDIHYGNNIYMPHGTYHIWVHVNHVRAVFIVTVT